MTQSPIEAQRIVGQVSAQALQDADFRTKLQADARGELAKAGLEIPENVKVEMLSTFDEIPAENRDPNTMYLVLDTTGAELSHEDLSAMAGGAGGQISTAGSIGSCLSTLQPDGSPLG